MEVCDFVNYPLAKKLKEAGFSQDYGCYGCKFIYSNETTIKRISEIGAYDRDYYGESLPCPTIAQVLKWLREEKELHISIGYSNVSKWRYIVIHLGDNFAKEPNIWEKNYDSYESAAIAGVEYILDNLI